MTRLSLVAIAFACLCLVEAIRPASKLPELSWPSVEVEDNFQFYTCVWSADNNTCTIQKGISAGCAWAKLLGFEGVYKYGWSLLTLVTNASCSDDDQVQAAGYLEGAITTDLIWASFVNFQDIVKTQFNSSEYPPSYLLPWLTNNTAYLREMISQNRNSVYWNQIRLIMLQTEAMARGYSDYASPDQPVALSDFYLMNMDGDLESLASFLPAQPQPPSAFSLGHCTGFIRLTDDLSDLYAAHTTWEGYQNMNRMFKGYVMPLSQAAAVTSLFSGYPGVLLSTDDFYVLSSNLVTLETTNNIFNSSLNALVTPHCVYSWMRSIVANRLAASAAEWVRLFAEYNSGTYNNQWMAVDYNLFTPGTPPPPNTLWIIEQLPGSVAMADVTSYLALGYWWSFNVPFFPEVYDVSGYPAAAEQYGPLLTYAGNPRANIFRRQAGDVETFDDVMKFIRYNNWQHDPLSHGNPGNAISSRFDLVVGNWTNPFLQRGLFGSVDGKVTSAFLVKNLMAAAQSSPTHDQQPPFDWREWPGVLHEGQPELFDFEWIWVDSDTSFVERMMRTN